MGHLRVFHGAGGLRWGKAATRSDMAEAERAEGGAAGSNEVVPEAQERGRSTLPSRAVRIPPGTPFRQIAADPCSFSPGHSGRQPRTSGAPLGCHRTRYDASR
jgi:hypothetical protein